MSHLLVMQIFQAICYLRDLQKTFISHESNRIPHVPVLTYQSMSIQLHIIVIRLDKVHDRPPFHPRGHHPKRSRVLERLSIDTDEGKDVWVFELAPY
jgi:hypothetical protein